MSWLYLAVSLWGAWFSYNAHRPHARDPRFSVVSFASGWLTSELALHHVAWQALATVFFGWLGAFEHWPGRLGLIITLGSWGSLVITQVKAGRSFDAFESALRRGLGDDYREHILPQLDVRLSEAVDWRRILLPFPIRSKRVERIRDVQYAREGGIDLKLDVYRSRDASHDAPVLFQVHGGGWIMGSKDEHALPLMDHLAARGWVCVTADYRLSPHATFPDHLIDLKRALRWVKEHITDYGGDPNFVVVTGGSAGGHLCSLLALTENDPEYQPGFEGTDTSVRGCVPFYGVYDFADRHATWPHEGLKDILSKQVMKGSLEEIPEAWDRASPIARIHPEAPPFFVIHGDSDTLVPVAQAREFVRTLREKSRAPVAYAELEGAQHAFELFPSLRTMHAANAVDRYLAWLYTRYVVEERGFEGR